MQQMSPKTMRQYICWGDAPTGAIALKFGMQGDIADIIIHAKFCDNRFRGDGVSEF